MTIRDILRTAVREALLHLGAGDVSFSLEYAERPEHGDYSTNAALLSTKAFKKSPLEIAELLKSELAGNKKLGAYTEKIEIARPGFVNFFLSSEFLQKSVGEIVGAKEKFGKRTALKESVNIEFISANPTGPLTLANGRGGFFGDVLGNILAFAGARVTKEYYINDAGNQIKTLGESVLAAGNLMPSAEQHYKGVYIAGYAKEFMGELKKFADDPEVLGKKVADAILVRDIKPAVKRAGIRFDVWTSEASDIRNEGLVEKTLREFEKREVTYKKDEALWLKTSVFGDTEDRVLVKSGAQKDYTYLAVDIAYHIEKWKRGCVKLITIWGADHHGAIARLNAAMQILGKPKVDIILMQLVRLVEGGVEIRMSKRTGTYVTLAELLDEVGVDVARFFFLMREPSSHMDFDLALAKEQSQKNPVYYVQYAHARIAGVLKKAKERGDRKAKKDLSLLQKPEEFTLIKTLLRFPELVEDVARTHEVHRLPQYAITVATAFHKFYDTTRVIDADRNVSAARLMLVGASKIVLASTLKLMGISTPDRM